MKEDTMKAIFVLIDADDTVSEQRNMMLKAAVARGGYISWMPAREFMKEEELSPYMVRKLVESGKVLRRQLSPRKVFYAYA